MEIRNLEPFQDNGDKDNDERRTMQAQLEPRNRNINNQHGAEWVRVGKKNRGEETRKNTQKDIRNPAGEIRILKRGSNLENVASGSGTKTNPFLALATEDKEEETNEEGEIIGGKEKGNADPIKDNEDEIEERGEDEEEADEEEESEEQETDGKNEDNKELPELETEIPENSVEIMLIVPHVEYTNAENENEEEENSDEEEEGKNEEEENSDEEEEGNVLGELSRQIQEFDSVEKQSTEGGAKEISGKSKMEPVGKQNYKKERQMQLVTNDANGKRITKILSESYDNFMEEARLVSNANKYLTDTEVKEPRQRKSKKQSEPSQIVTRKKGEGRKTKNNVING